MAKVVALWYGGCNYAAPNPDRDLERFDSLKAAARAFEARADHDPFYPCVEEEQTEMHVYFGTAYHENGPDRLIRFGRRGAVRVERG